jgi:radical SAM protein with 4Fe4S-binding SPASM domain
MPLELAKKIIIEEVEKVKRSEVNDSLKIDLFGGEPLMNFPFIKDFTEWVLKSVDIPFIIYATTNGTLLDKEKQRWFREHKDDFVLVMSVDGDSGMQEANRGVLLEQLPVEFARELWPDQPLKMTISRHSIKTVSKGMISLVQKGYLVDARLAQGENWEREDAIHYRRELETIARFFIENPRYQPPSLFTKLHGNVLTAGTPVQYCGTGTNMTAYDVDGKAYPCHLFSPIVLGRDARGDLDKINFRDPAELTDPECAGCKLERVCPTCVGYNYFTRGNARTKDKSMCWLMLEEARVTSAFQINYYMQKKHALADEEILKLKASLKVHEITRDLDFGSELINHIVEH